jgi:hypothetical protein
MSMSSEADLQPNKSTRRLAPLPSLEVALGRLVRILHEEGIRKERIYELYRRGGIIRRDQTFRTWAANARIIASARRSLKKRGRRPALEQWEIRILLGYILELRTKYVAVNKTMLCDFVMDKFGKTVSTRTISRILEMHGFRVRTSKVLVNASPRRVDELAKIYLNWIFAQRANGNLHLEPSRIGSVDCTYTSHRTHRVTTICPIGE